MPSGSTHDRITLWSLPAVAGLTLALTKRSDLTLIVSGGFLFSGLMFGPDLDIHSRQFIRWGWLRWIWVPYQKGLRHRSIFSHGFLFGTTLRIIYLGFWLVALALCGFILLGLVSGNGWSWAELGKSVVRSLTYHYPQWIALFVGLEIGAMSHSFSDWGNSAYKRFKKKGIQALIPRVARKKQTPGKKAASTVKRYNVKQVKSQRKTRKNP